MTVNDGLPLDESGADDSDYTEADRASPLGTDLAGHLTDPPTDLLPLNVASPPGPPATPSAPADPATEGSVEGDLFDGLAGP